MKTFISVVALLALSTVSYAGETTQGAANAQVDTSTSHNPLTKTTTKTIKRKAKYHHKMADGQVVDSQDQVKIQKKTADDGSKVKTTTETTHTDQNSN